ncbi:MAG: glycosyltransferase family 39 protein, partial [Phycisphaerales bacterium]|nr:glycosyltransferase family 39 protein [Phycisphaerales bacterium]
MLGALLLRLLYLTTILNTPFFDHPVNDEMQYDAWAQALAAGQSYLGNYPYWDSPWHAYVLGAIYWLFGHNLLAVRLIQVIVGTINVLLLYRLALRIFDSTVAVVVGLLAATY